MPSKWAQNIEFKEITLRVEEQFCKKCGSPLITRKDRIHCISGLEAPLKLICKLSCCSNKQCALRRTLISPKSEIALTAPRWRIGWDLLLWMGFRRFKRHWSVPQISSELRDTDQIDLATKTICDYLSKYQLMVSARHQDIELWIEEYKSCSDLILSIDGLQPEKGHETLYVVRELRKKRVWFAEPLLSISAAEIQKLFQRAKELAKHLNKPIKAWISDKQDAFVTGIALEFPDAIHRYCSNHFIRDLAKLVLEKDSNAKVQMRRKVRGLRQIEKETLVELDQKESRILTEEEYQYAADIVFDYCAVVRGILNDNKGGPLKPPGLRMYKALEEVSKSLEDNLKLGETPIRSKLNCLNNSIKRGLLIYDQQKAEIEKYTKMVTKVMKTITPTTSTVTQRVEQFIKIQNRLRNASRKNEIEKHMMLIMQSFGRGLFVGSDDSEIPDDNLDLERWFKKPKGHERRIHGRKHTGIRLVYEGPTLLLALDAHLSREKPFSYSELLPYVEVEVPDSQRKSVERNRIMRKASSKKKESLCWKI